MIGPLTLQAAITLALMAVVLLLGVHMMLRPAGYVGRGPIPARSAANVRVMGLLFAILGGMITAMIVTRMFVQS